MSRFWGVRICWVFVGRNSNYRLIFTHCKLQPHAGFLNSHSQLVWLPASSGFYSITLRMISRSADTKFIFESSLHSEETFFPCRCDIFRFFEFLLLGNSSTAPVFSYNQISKQPENLYLNYRERFGYFTQLAETSLFNNAILHLNEIIKQNAVVIRNYSWKSLETASYPTSLFWWKCARKRGREGDNWRDVWQILFSRWREEQWRTNMQFLK